MEKPAITKKRMEKPARMQNPPLCAQFPLQEQKILKKAMMGALSLLSGAAGTIFLALFLFPAQVSRLGLSSFAGLFLFGLGALCAALLSYEYFYFRRYYYDMGNDVLIIRKGVFTLSETSLPYGRIQDVTVARDLLDKAFGLYNIYVSTAGSQAGFVAHIDGLSEQGAQEIKKMLLFRLRGRRR